VDLSQRVIVKALVSRHLGAHKGRTVLARHIDYLQRSGASEDGERPVFFDSHREQVEAKAEAIGWGSDRHHFRLIISPEHGDRLSDLRGYVREVMAKVAADLGEPQLTWMAVCHFDTDQPHAHVLVRGRRSDGRDLVMPRAYVSYGLRRRAQEVAQAELGKLTRSQAEDRVWRETVANRFTQLDRRLIEAADADGTVADGVGAPGAWRALSRGRLRHLEALGLAEHRGRRYLLVNDLEAQLRAAQLRIDVIRTLNQRRLEGAKRAELARGVVHGEVVKAGFHDELGTAGFVIVRDKAKNEHYAVLRAGAALPQNGSHVRLEARPEGRGVIVELSQRAGLNL
jgi:type IV secretory pathway VirD2 relaxase